MTGAVLENDTKQVLYYMDQFYFEAAATILTLITVGKMLEAGSKGKTTNALRSLMDLSPKTAVVVRDGAEQTRGGATVASDEAGKVVWGQTGAMFSLDESEEYEPWRRNTESNLH
jgi:cation transport ATPase